MAKFRLKIENSTPLGVSATFTSPSFGTDESSVVSGTVFADQTGTAYVDQSWDNVNFDVSDSIAVTANTGAKINVNVAAPYARVRYVNSTTAQTVFRIFAGIKE